jgi:cytochrome c1
MSRILLLLAIAAAIALLTACEGGRTAPTYLVYTGGNAHHGAQLIQQYRCGSCHTIPGIRNSQGLVGPPLYFFSRRTMIAGELPNTPVNLVHWIESPKSIEPGTAMPQLGLSEQEARDVAAYLYTLH